MKARSVSAWISENSGVLLHQARAGHDGRGPWDLPTARVDQAETDSQALSGLMKTLVEVPFVVGDCVAEVELESGERRAVYLVTLDLTNGPPRMQPVGVLGWFGKQRLEDSAIEPVLIAALSTRIE
jgi:hypothetical protein